MQDPWHQSVLGIQAQLVDAHGNGGLQLCQNKLPSLRGKSRHTKSEEHWRAGGGKITRKFQAWATKWDPVSNNKNILNEPEGV